MNIRSALISLLALCSYGVALPVAASDIYHLDRDLSPLIADFNAADDRVRLVFIVGPTCPVCRQGLSEMTDDVLAGVPADSRLAIFVIHVPTLSAKAEDVATTFALFDDERARQYWDDRGTSGIRFQRTLSLSSYAWDVWMIFNPEARWVDKDPPAPLRWWHQLKGVAPQHRLDIEQFSTVLNDVLTASSTRHQGGS